MRNPFAALFRKESMTQSQIVALHLGRPVWTTARYDKLAQRGYMMNPYVFSCVQVLTRAASGIEWQLKRRGPENDELILEHPLLELWKRPNPEMGSSRFLENAVGFLKLSGNAYMEGVYAGDGSAGRTPPQELWFLRPDRTKVVPGYVPGSVAYYEYKVGSYRLEVPADRVKHLKTFAPLDDWYGLSPLQVAARSMDQNNYSTEWNVALLQNMARPSGAFVLEGYPSDAEFRSVKNRLTEQYTEMENAGRPLVIGGGVDWKQLSLSPVDMDWLEGQKQSAREIAITMGVSPELIGDSANKTHANYGEARRALYEETVLPDMDWLRDEFNSWLVPQYGDDRLYLDYDRDRIEALQEDRASVWSMTREMAKDRILTIEEAREAIGYPRDYPSGDTLVPTGREGEVSVLSTTVETRQWSPGDDEDARRKAYEKKEADRDPWYGEVTALVRDRFNGEREAVLEAVAGAASLPGVDLLAEQAVDEEAAAMYGTLSAAFIAVAEAFGQETFDGLLAEVSGKALPAVPTVPGVSPDVEAIGFDVGWNGVLDTYVAGTTGEAVKSVTNTTKKSIKSIVLNGVERGWSIGELASAIDRLYLDEIIPNRSEVIARTEVIRASNFGSQLGALQTGLDLDKEWLATYDDRTRDAHKSLIVTVPIEEPFKVGGEELMFPGDTSMGASAGNVINCRCSESYVPHGASGW